MTVSATAVFAPAAIDRFQYLGGCPGRLEAYRAHRLLLQPRGIQGTGSLPEPRLRVPGLVTRHGNNRPGVGSQRARPVCGRLLTSLSSPDSTAASAMFKISDA